MTDSERKAETKEMEEAIEFAAFVYRLQNERIEAEWKAARTKLKAAIEKKQKENAAAEAKKAK